MAFNSFGNWRQWERLTLPKVTQQVGERPVVFCLLVKQARGRGAVVECVQVLGQPAEGFSTQQMAFEPGLEGRVTVQQQYGTFGLGARLAGECPWAQACRLAAQQGGGERRSASCLSMLPPLQRLAIVTAWPRPSLPICPSSLLLEGSLTTSPPRFPAPSLAPGSRTMCCASLPARTLALLHPLPAAGYWPGPVCLMLHAFLPVLLFPPQGVAFFPLLKYTHSSLTSLQRCNSSWSFPEPPGWCMFLLSRPRPPSPKSVLCISHDC